MPHPYLLSAENGKNGKFLRATDGWKNSQLAIIKTYF